MSHRYDQIAFTDAVKQVQERYGSRAFYDRRHARGRSSTRSTDGEPLSEEERRYLEARDSFYLATVNELGWPYVQFRGGPPGLLRVLDEHTIGWADFRGNLQYISTGNLATQDRVALIVMDYPNRQRLKIFGRARVAFVEDEPELVERLTVADYEAVVQRGVVVSVEAFDWNCQQHITPRYSPAELEPVLAAMTGRIRDLEDQNTQLTARQSGHHCSHTTTGPDVGTEKRG